MGPTVLSNAEDGCKLTLKDYSPGSGLLKEIQLKLKNAEGALQECDAVE